jgi:hypothetical protein
MVCIYGHTDLGVRKHHEEVKVKTNKEMTLLEKDGNENKSRQK